MMVHIKRRKFIYNIWINNTYLDELLISHFKLITKLMFYKLNLLMLYFLGGWRANGMWCVCLRWTNGTKSEKWAIFSRNENFKNNIFETFLIKLFSGLLFEVDRSAQGLECIEWKFVEWNDVSRDHIIYCISICA